MTLRTMHDLHIKMVFQPSRNVWNRQALACLLVNYKLPLRNIVQTICVQAEQTRYQVFSEKKKNQLPLLRLF